MNSVQNIIYLNRAISNKVVGLPPDKCPNKPADDFVMCRDSKGNPTAVYGEDSWDFNPYRSSAKRLNKIGFVKGFECDDTVFSERLVKEVKYLLFIVMHFNGGGRSGKISASTFVQYAIYLKTIVRFCITNLENDLAAGIGINDVLSNASYLNAFIKSRKHANNTLKLTNSLLGILGVIDKESLDFIACDRNNLDLERTEDKQHPVIPSRIYIGLIGCFDAAVDELYPHRESIKKLIEKMINRQFGLAISTQRAMKEYRKKTLQPTMTEAFSAAGLDGLLSKYFPQPESRHGFNGWLANIQFILKMSIHLYTGMRDQETARIKYECLNEREICEAVFDDQGNIADKARVVSIISTTTKYTGYKQLESWLAPKCVLKSVAIARAICEGLATLYKTEAKGLPLFLSSYIIRSENTELKATINNINDSSRGVFANMLNNEEFAITQADLYELIQIDSGRDFKNEEKFKVGNLWTLTSHQFRRSLAFYAANSGFVSLPTVSTQFKHLSNLMTKYYARGNEHFLPIFGRLNDKLNAFDISKSHIANEFQLAVPTSAVDQLFSDVFGDQTFVMGGTGSYIEKQKKRVSKGEITIFDSKKQTMKMASKGELSYRKTLLGGCTKVGPCDEFLMGDITSCLSCPGAIIDAEKIDSVIAKSKEEILNFEEDSAEYQLLNAELNQLKDFQSKKHKTFAEAV